MTSIFELLGRDDGCRALSKSFYARVARDPVLKPLFPGKSLRCATEEFAAFLVQFFDGDESKTQYRWWLSLRESHRRFEITEEQRSAWINLMTQALLQEVSCEHTRKALGEFFVIASWYIVGRDAALPDEVELATLWRRQLQLEDLVEKLANGHDIAAIKSAKQFSNQLSVLVGILAKMIATGRQELVAYAIESIEQDPELCERCFNGRTLLHYAAGCGCVGVLKKLLDVGANPNAQDAGGHSPLYRAASCDREEEAEAVVRLLVAAGAKVNHGGGVTCSTALHQAARHGNHRVAAALLELGAYVNATDSRGLTALDRAINCRRRDVADLLARSTPTKTSI